MCLSIWGHEGSTPINLYHVFRLVSVINLSIKNHELYIQVSTSIIYEILLSLIFSSKKMGTTFYRPYDSGLKIFFGENSPKFCLQTIDFRELSWKNKVLSLSLSNNSQISTILQTWLSLISWSLRTSTIYLLGR